MLQVFLYILLASPVFCAIDLTVVTAKGSINGQRASDGNYTTFFGIPYAKVDEDNPFGNSVDYPAFDTPFEATDATIKCPQPDAGSMTLDCLRLNIYVPNSANTNSPVPVFVWFHGGVFSMGSGGDYGGKYLVEKDIIVVTVNYRLGPYGFLCLDDPTVPGNQGLKDQITALRWIKENIAAFGGKADQVTIAGQSAGGGAVDLHLYSLYETLFDKAIVQSGSSFVEGQFVKADHESAIKLATELGYEAHNTRDALDFLIAADPTRILKAFEDLNLELRPCQEKQFEGVQNFVHDDPFHMQSPRMKDVDILVGYNSREEFRGFISRPEDYFTNLGPYFYDKLEKNFVLKKHELERVAQIVQRYYLGSKPISKETALEICDFFNDFVCNRAAEMSVNKYLEQGAQEVYKYIFSYVGIGPYSNHSGAGASHGDELAYLFDIAEEPLSTDEQKLIRDSITTLWANFVKYGNPTPVVSELPIIWEPVTRGSDSKPYLNIDVKMEMLDSVYHDRIAFWELFNEVYWQNSVLIDKRKHK